MHDNPPARSAPDFALPDHYVISLTGRDAGVFAQAQFMNDVMPLASGHWQWNGWLTPKGRVIALFALLRIDDETVWLLLPDADPTALVEALQRFVFRSKLTLTVRDELKVAGAFTAAAVAQGSRFDRSATGAVALDMGGQGAPRTLCIGVDAAGADDALAARWHACDLQHGLPRLPTSQAGLWTPQQLSLERVQAFSVKKGCYPGQEIVARTHFLGKAKRGLALLEASAAMAVGAEVLRDGAVIGTIVCSASDEQRSLALAVLPLERIEQAMTVEGQSVSERTLRDGLAR